MQGRDLEVVIRLAHLGGLSGSWRASVRRVREQTIGRIFGVRQCNAGDLKIAKLTRGLQLVDVAQGVKAPSRRRVSYVQARGAASLGSEVCVALEEAGASPQ